MLSSIDDDRVGSSIELCAGETITCTFTNTKRGHIVVDKVTNPTGSSQCFDFDPAYGLRASILKRRRPAEQLRPAGPGHLLRCGGHTVAGRLGSDEYRCVSSIGTPSRQPASSWMPVRRSPARSRTRERGNIVVDKVTNPAGFDAVVRVRPVLRAQVQPHGHRHAERLGPLASGLLLRRGGHTSPGRLGPDEHLVCQLDR